MIENKLIIRINGKNYELLNFVDSTLNMHKKSFKYLKVTDPHRKTAIILSAMMFDQDYSLQFKSDPSFFELLSLPTKIEKIPLNSSALFFVDLNQLFKRFDEDWFVYYSRPDYYYDSPYENSFSFPKLDIKFADDLKSMQKFYKNSFEVMKMHFRELIKHQNVNGNILLADNEQVEGICAIYPSYGWAPWQPQSHLSSHYTCIIQNVAIPLVLPHYFNTELKGGIYHAKLCLRSTNKLTQFWGAHGAPVVAELIEAKLIQPIFSKPKHPMIANRFSKQASEFKMDFGKKLIVVKNEIKYKFRIFEHKLNILSLIIVAIGLFIVYLVVTSYQLVEVIFKLFNLK